MFGYIECLSGLFCFYMFDTDNSKRILMKKTAFALLLAGAAMGDESGWYVGLSGGDTELKIKAFNGVTHSTITKEGKNGELKIGYYLDGHQRIHLFYQDSNPVSDTDGRMYGLGYSYLIGEAPIKPYIGVMVGHFRVKQNGNNELSDTFIGTQAGLSLAVLEKISLEAGYRYLVPKGDPHAIGSYTFEADRLRNWYAGITYRF